MTRIFAVLLLLLLLLVAVSSHPTMRAAPGGTAAARASAGHSQLVGAWKPVLYHVDGQDVPMSGLMIFTPRYFSSNVLFELTGGAVPDANANAGSYRVEGSRVIFDQWVQIHLRPGASKEQIFSAQGSEETAEYRIEGKRLVIIFPSKNRFVLERIE